VPDLPTRLDFFALGRDYVTQRATKLDPAHVDTSGSDANLFVGIAAILGAQLSRQLAYRTGALLLASADGEDLDRLAYDRYNLTRKGASPARGSIRIARATLAAGAGTVAIGTKIQTLQGAEYVTTSTAIFGVADSFATCAARATQAGKATQVGSGSVQRFSQPQLLFDTTLVPSNPAPMAGGEDVEDDDTFRARVRDFWRSARRGVLAAIEFGALTVPGVVSAQAVEALSVFGTPARVVNLYISDSSGVASDVLASDVLVALEDYRAAGITVLVFTSIPQIVSIKLALTFAAGVDTRALTDLVRSAVFEFINSLPVNGTLLIGELFSVLQRFAGDGLIPVQSSIVLPVGDLVPNIGQTIRTTLENVVVS
jgi:hypothetical protein